MEELKNLLVGFVSKTLKLDETAVASELFESDGDTLKVKENALTYLTGLDAQRVKQFNDAAKTKFQDGYQKAKKEERSAFESEIREKFGIQSDKIGLDLIEDVVSTAAKAPADVTDEVVKKHPSFIKRERELLAEKENAIKEINDRIRLDKNTETFLGKSIDYLKSELKPVLPADEKKAKNQINLFMGILKNIKHDVLENGDITLLNPDGSRMEDAHGHPVDWKEHVKTLAGDYFDFDQSSGRSAGRNPAGGGQGGQGGGAVKKPATKAEYMKRSAEILSDRSLSLADQTKMLVELKELAADLPD